MKIFAQYKAKKNTNAAIMKILWDLSAAATIRSKGGIPLSIDIPESTFWNYCKNKITGERRIVGAQHGNEIVLFPEISKSYPFLTQEEIKKRLRPYDDINSRI